MCNNIFKIKSAPRTATVTARESNVKKLQTERKKKKLKKTKLNKTKNAFVNSVNNDTDPRKSNLKTSSKTRDMLNIVLFGLELQKQSKFD